MKIWLSLLILTAALSLGAAAQTVEKKNTAASAPVKTAAAKASPAYAEILLRKTELLSDLESLLVEYTEEFPKVKEIRYENDLLQKELDRLLAVPAADAGRLTLALGKLMVRKAELETDLWTLRKEFNDDYPDVKRARRKAEIFENAIREILQGK